MPWLFLGISRLFERAHVGGEHVVVGLMEGADRDMSLIQNQLRSLRREIAPWYPGIGRKFLFLTLPQRLRDSNLSCGRSPLHRLRPLTMASAMTMPVGTLTQVTAQISSSQYAGGFFFAPIVTSGGSKCLK